MGMGIPHGQIAMGMGIPHRQTGMGIPSEQTGMGIPGGWTCMGLICTPHRLICTCHSLTNQSRTCPGGLEIGQGQTTTSTKATKATTIHMYISC